jgi:hypothetical protein
MQEQIAFINTPAFSDFMRGLPAVESAQSLIHGIWVYPHPVWIRMTQMLAETGSADPYWSQDWLHLEPPEGLLDLTQSPFYWEQYCNRAGKKSNEPFIVRIYIDPVTNQTIGLRRQIQAYAGQQPFFVSVVEEEPGWLASSVDGGEKLSAPGTGTLGGFLKDMNNTVYGVTCGHVAKTAGVSFGLPDLAGVHIANAGMVLHSNHKDFQPTPASGTCNQYVQPSHPDVDIALLELDPAHAGTAKIINYGTVVDISDRTVLGSGSTIGMHGAVSKKHDYTIGGYGVTARLRDRGTKTSYCFSHLFDFASPQANRGGRAGQALAPRPLAGDSGSFVCHTLASGDLALFGLLIAASGTKGIACFADSIIKWADDEEHLTLTHL